MSDVVADADVIANVVTAVDENDISVNIFRLFLTENSNMLNKFRSPNDLRSNFPRIW